MLRTANPALNSKSFGGFAGGARATFGRSTEGESMTIQGTVNKTGILLALLIAAAVVPWHQFFEARDPAEIGRAHV